MPYQIGTDEAGYGPNLGPLVVAGTMWRTPHQSDDLYELLHGLVSSVSATADLLHVADSKQVYSASRALGKLELPVLACIHAWLDRIPGDSCELVQDIGDADSIEAVQDQCWLSGRILELPIAACPEQVKRMGESFRLGCERVGVELKQARASIIFPPEFNHGVRNHGNKASLLSTVTLRSVRELLNASAGKVTVGCDKHGGRSKYAAMIQEVLTEEFVFVETESLEVSQYRFSEPDRNVRLRFQARGESFLPTALASMVAKYLRELFMLLWNDFWQLEIPDLKPTKGYPQDARRFKRQIATRQQELGISDHEIWRNR